ncbi:MAG: alpha/beta fold hydrolase, partial [Anaerolineae bacterium]|nr:alpha/beta fold hydrolase [Anaerolineae bacterium]
MKRVLSLVCGVMMMFLVSAGFTPASQAASITDAAPVAASEALLAGADHSMAESSGVRKDLPPKCVINWKPSVLLPVSSHSEFFDASNGAPGPLQVFYPSLGRFADTPITSLLNGCGQYPLVIFLHGHRIGDPNVYLRWTRLPAMLARSGSVVVAPRLPNIAGGSSPFSPNGDQDLALAQAVLTWMQTGWTYHDALAPSPRPAIVGHSFGAILGARL